MSVQLILYPQTHNGEVSIFASSNEFVVNGINFSNLSTSSSYDSPQNNNIDVLNDALTNQPAVTNTWVRYRSITPTPALPTNTSNNVAFYSLYNGSHSGIYQKLSNLVIGTNYTILLLMFQQQEQDL
jgi:hypothetical protein